MTEDDRAIRDRLAALEAEVKAEADVARARKQAALDKLRAQRAADQAESDNLRKRQSALVARRRDSEAEHDHGDGMAGALELATKANRVKQELAKKPGKGEKSWIKSGLASMALGPVGWLYAGSLREAVPASVGWILLMTVLTKILPSVLLMPVLMVVLPLSGIAGVVYALQYNRHGGRQRLFDKDKPKQLPGGG